MKNETARSTKRLTERAILMVRNLTVRFVLLRSLINVNMLAARLMMTSASNMRIMVFRNMMTVGLTCEGAMITHA